MPTLLESKALREAIAERDVEAFDQAAAAVRASIARRDPPLPQLATPDPVTIFDLPSIEGVEVVRLKGYAAKWRKAA